MTYYDDMVVVTNKKKLSKFNEMEIDIFQFLMFKYKTYENISKN